MNSASRAMIPALGDDCAAPPFLGLGLLDAKALRVVAAFPRRRLRLVAAPRAFRRVVLRAGAEPPRPSGRRLQIRLCRETSGS